ncbi:MAG: Cof-type HAD-IIB family hydrolase [Peptococcaceae bacterium]|nr:Cof-type HAD-IIB family hydrolase [Peptococcaceae bacterium]
MIKLVALDLDDTTLDSESKISSRTAATIRAAMAQGVTVTLATGRMYRSALPFALELGLDVPLITYHGALVKTSLGHEVLYHRPVPLDLASYVLAFASKRRFDINLYMDDQVYVREDNRHIEDYIKLSKVPYCKVADLNAVLCTEPDKILIIDEEAKLDGLARDLKEMVGSRLHITKSKPYFLEITHPEAQKGIALATLATKLGIDRSQVMAVGDSYNDLDMLEYAGIGVAMGNARTEIKDRADFITLSNNEHGVAEAFKRFVLSAEYTASLEV